MDGPTPVVTSRLLVPATVRRTPVHRVPIRASLLWSDGYVEGCTGWALQWAWFGDGVFPQVECQLTSERLGHSVTTWVEATPVRLV